MIRPLILEEIPCALQLIWKVFLEFEAPEYSYEGVKTFHDFINDKKEIGSLTLYGAFCESKLVGVIAMRGGSHISMFFVKKEYHRMGYGRRLFETVLQNTIATKITVNSSPYAVEVYHKLGFKNISDEQVKDGIRFTPMVFERAYKIEQLNPEDYHKCNNIWNMQSDPYTEQFYNEIASGIRLVYIYKVNNEFIAEGALVTKNEDPDYTIPGKRVYLSRMIVKPDYTNKGIGGIMLEFLIQKAKDMGYCEISLGVDCDNQNAVHLYQKHGFTEVIFEGEDEHGKYMKLLKRIYAVIICDTILVM